MYLIQMTKCYEIYGSMDSVDRNKKRKEFSHFVEARNYCLTVCMQEITCGTTNWYQHHQQSEITLILLTGASRIKRGKRENK